MSSGTRTHTGHTTQGVHTQHTRVHAHTLTRTHTQTHTHTNTHRGHTHVHHPTLDPLTGFLKRLQRF